jgi:thiol-disulfide isomerase/thioredoxin
MSRLLTHLAAAIEKFSKTKISGLVRLLSCNFNNNHFIYLSLAFTFTPYFIIMKKIVFTLVIIFVMGTIAFAQNQFQVMVERPGEKTYKGIISREALMADTSFKWVNNAQTYTADKNAVEGLKKNKDSIQLLVFMGTWCEDSQDIIPKFYSLTDVAGFSQTRITLIGVDREKKTLSHLTEALGIINVPTIIVMKNGKEMGRVVEYGKYGMFDKELGEIISSLH